MKIYNVVVNVKKLKVTVEIGFEDIGENNNIEDVKLDLRSGLKELVFETTSEYPSIVSFNIDEIVLDEDGVDKDN